MKLDLQSRLAAALFGLAVAVGGLVAGVLWLSHVRIEQALLDTILERELVLQLQNRTAQHPVSPARDGFALYRPSRLAPVAPPPEVARLPPGSYRDVRIDGAHFHVLVRDLAPGDRAWFLYDVSQLERREEQLRLALIAGLLAAGAASWLAGRAIARRLVAPVRGVVRRIETLDLERRAPLAVEPGDGELAPVVGAVNALLRELEILVQRERAFAAAAAHELRTPLTSIRLAADALAGDAAARAPLARIERAVQSSAATLDALLALSRGREAPPAESLAVHELLPQLAQPYEDAARAGQTRIAWRLQPVRAILAPGALTVIFTNLLRNAIRAAPQGEVAVELDEHGLSMIDNGVGIAPEDLPRIFEPGMRSHGGGSGVGLYISRELAQRYGWTLALTSAPEKGTRARLQWSAPIS